MRQPVTCPACGKTQGEMTAKGVEVRRSRSHRPAVLYDALLPCRDDRCDGEVRIVAGRLVLRSVKEAS